MTELTVPNQFTEQFPEFKTLRVFGTVEDPLFLALDVQQMLEISKINYNQDYEENEDYYKIKINHAGQMREMVAFTEHGLYGIIFRSRTGTSSKFRKFLTGLLKCMRKEILTYLTSIINSNEPKESHLYLLNAGESYKIGRTSDIRQRQLTLQTGCPEKITLIKLWENKGHKESTAHLRASVIMTRTVGEWFVPRTVASIKDLINDLDTL